MNKPIDKEANFYYNVYYALLNGSGLWKDYAYQYRTCQEERSREFDRV